MIQPIQIRNVEIGSGVPKVIVPIVGKTEEAILAKAGEIIQLNGAWISTTMYLTRKRRLQP